MLDAADRQAFWAAFKSSPLFKDWKAAEAELSFQFDKIVRRPTQTIFRTGETAEYLYLVGDGRVQETFKHEGVIWLQREYKRGDHFGQHALFGDDQLSDAVALTDVVLYAMPASDLRTALERNLGLYETLLQEKKASRLRTIPLFRGLSDAELVRLAQVLEEVTYAAGKELPLRDRKGLYIIDYGQVEVAGPASLERPGWRLTAGNFFLTEGVLFGQRCVATQARARMSTHVFFLPAIYSDHLIPAFRDVGLLVAAPLDIAALLANIPLFSDQRMTVEQRWHLAEFFGWGFVPDRQNITTQGAVGHSFVILREGAGVASSVDDQGRMRPHNHLQAVQYYGETSLLQGKQRDATVRAVIGRSENDRPPVRGADVLTLDRRDLQYAFNQRKELWRSGVDLVDRFEKIQEVKRQYEWQTEGEAIVWQGRRHRLWLILPLARLTLIIGGLMLLVVLLDIMGLDALRIFGGILLAMGLAVALYFVYDYRDDYYVVTNRRVARRDRIVLLFTETLMEAPIETVQDANIKQDFWGRFFDFGDLTIRTAAKVGAIDFLHVPTPDVIKRHILEGRALAAAVARGQQREVFRRNLLAGLRLVLPIPERKRAIGDVEPSEARQQPLARLGRIWRPRPKSALRQLPSRQNTLPVRAVLFFIRPLPKRLRKAIADTISSNVPVVQLGENLWRKHPIILILRAWLPLVGAIALILTLPIVNTFFRSLGQPTAMWLIPWLGLMLLCGGRLWWVVEDYFNDVYIVTDEKIIDIEMKPLGLDYNRREGSLERVQTVNTVQSGVVAQMLNYGSVIIRTAAEGEAFDFKMIPNPRHVQQVIFQKMDALRQRQETKRISDRQQELIESLKVYDDLRAASDRAGSRIF